MLTRASIVLRAAVISFVLLAPLAGPRAQTQAEDKVIRLIRERLLGRKPTTRPTTRPATRPAKTDTLEDCRKLYMQGRYSQAGGGFRKLVSKKPRDVALAVGLARTLAMTGQYDKSLEALKRVSEAGAKDAGWHLTTADALAAVGKYADALTHAERANKLKPKWAPTILARGLLLETFGRKKEALAVYKTMDEIVAGDAYRGDAPSLVALGGILDRYAVLSGRKASAQASNILHNYLQEAYQEVDEKYWPANVAAGHFLLSKHRAMAAVKEFQLALKHNKHIPAVHAGMAAAALTKWRFEACMGLCGQALKINPKYADALVLKAVCLLQWRKFDQVPPVLEKVLDVNPNHLQALSLMAAVHVRTHHEDKAKPFMARVRKINPTYAGLPNAIGQWLAAGRQFQQAEKHYLEAIKLAPEQAGPVANLAKLYMQTGDEDKAKETLEKARELDDFRKDIYNFLQLLKKMAKFKTVETPHFIVKVDGDHDEVLLAQVAAYAEQMHEEVASDFAHTPPRKTLVEIFPTHELFSVRITGRGWIGTIGASTGRVIAMVAPSKERSQFGTFNWATVLRHEYTHTVTLSATRNRIPHWFTEACAVWQQPDRRNYEAVRKLVSAVRSGRLLPIKELDWGFIRPKRRADRGLAYAQAEWIMEYIIEAKGYQTVIKMLQGFREGWTQKEVFQKCLSTTEAKFDKSFTAWAKKQVETWGFKSDALPELSKAAKAAKAKPKDAAAQADLAVAQYVRYRVKEAEKTARKAIKLDPKNVRALAVLARVLARTKRYDEAIKTAQSLENVPHTSRTAPRVLADCYLAKRSWAKAIPALELLKQRMPLDPHSYQQLANLYTQLGQPGKALPNLIELHRRTMKDAQYARRIAEAYRSMDKEDLALRYFEQIAQINPYESSAYEAIASIRRNAGEYDKAVEAVRYVCILAPRSADAWAKMAMMRYLAGKAAKDKNQLRQARKDAEKALELDPDSQAKTIIEYIDAVLESLETNRAE